MEKNLRYYPIQCSMISQKKLWISNSVFFGITESLRTTLMQSFNVRWGHGDPENKNGYSMHPGNQQCSTYRAIALISQASKVTCKILKASLQQYLNQEVPNIQAAFRKGRGTSDQIIKIHWLLDRAREFQKNIYFCFIDYTKAFDCVHHKNCRKFLKRWKY